MSRNYKFHNPKGVYFISFAVVEWLDVFPGCRTISAAYRVAKPYGGATLRLKKT
jgi:hypothetical protein